MLCPACHVDLRQTDLGEYGFIVLDVCPTCKGAWFDKGELDRLDDSIWVNVEEHAFHDAQGDHKSASCPKCEVPLKPLSPTDAQELIVDRCPSCDGYWLDNGELERMGGVAEKEHNEEFEKALHVRQTGSLLEGNRVTVGRLGQPGYRPHGGSLLKWIAYEFKLLINKAD
ncbi:MAG TPA: hypothetical protein EYG03_30865 [Planctomycetes bacterium]|nr:hypothetical protein [Planctomycetota bacterium]